MQNTKTLISPPHGPVDGSVEPKRYCVDLNKSLHPLGSLLSIFLHIVGLQSFIYIYIYVCVCVSNQSDEAEKYTDYISTGGYHTTVSVLGMTLNYLMVWL